MIERWVKPLYQEVCVNGECTAYAGQTEDSTQQENSSAVRSRAGDLGSAQVAEEARQ
jgi:hypothetical protein